MVGLGIPSFLCETEVNDGCLVASLADTHEEVVGLNVPVDKVLSSENEYIQYKKSIGEQGAEQSSD